MKVTLRQAVNAIDFIEVCEESELQFEVEDSGIDVPAGGRVSFEWTGPQSYFAEEQFPIIESAQPAISGIYEVIGIVSGCATFPDTTEVTVYPTPEHDLGADDVICEKNNKIPVLNGGDFASYAWSTGENRQYIDAFEEGTYTLQFTDENGCIGIDSISFVRQCPTAIYMANIFTPSGTDIFDNQTFGVQGDDIISFRLEIYDRWGNVMFSTTDLENNWDGTFDGNFVNQGNYPWILEYEGYKDDGSIFQDKIMGTVLLLE